MSFYINVEVAFLDLLEDPRKIRIGDYHARGRIADLVEDASDSFDLKKSNVDDLKGRVIRYVRIALERLKHHLDELYDRAKAGLYSPIPVPETWKT